VIERGSLLLRPCPRRGQQQKHRGRVQEQRDDENEPPQDRLVVGADERRQIPHRAQIGLDSAALALDGGLLDLQVGEDLRLNRDLVGKVVALGLPPFVGGGCGAWRSATCSR